MTKLRLRIDEVLNQRGKSAYWLANELGMGHGNLYRYRKGKVNAINLDVLSRMCTLLECVPGDLLVLGESKPQGKSKAKKKR